MGIGCAWINRREAEPNPQKITTRLAFCVNRLFYGIPNPFNSTGLGAQKMSDCQQRIEIVHAGSVKTTTVEPTEVLFDWLHDVAVRVRPLLAVTPSSSQFAGVERTLHPIAALSDQGTETLYSIGG
jgi:hypothetical protein